MSKTLQSDSRFEFNRIIEKLIFLKCQIVELLKKNISFSNLWIISLTDFVRYYHWEYANSETRWCTIGRISSP